ncbi:MAG: type VI secretion system tip protein TssI/VgrG [Pseudomonadota bacterium]
MNERAVTAKTDLGDEVSFHHFTGKDWVSQPFDYRLYLISKYFDIEAGDVLGSMASVEVDIADGPVWFTGMIESFALIDFEQSAAIYEARLSPWLGFLRHTTDCRIFQDQTAVEIVEKIFSKHSIAVYDTRLQQRYPTYEYVVQYDESDLNFVSRLLEYEGIYYFFEHSADGHTLVLADHADARTHAASPPRILFRSPQGRGLMKEDHIDLWIPRSTVRSGSYAHVDYDFKQPGAELMSVSSAPLGHLEDSGEVYSHPGAHIDGENRVLARGDAIADIRRIEMQASHVTVEAGGPRRDLVSGCTFELADYPRLDQNDKHFVIEASHSIWNPVYRTGQVSRAEGRGAEGQDTEDYYVRFTSIPASTLYHPPRRTPYPVMRGPQTATVVGPAGEEIYPDEFARVKVQFHWDRLGGDDESSSCWVRVSQAWAGSGYGFIAIPRIGHEVIVDFIEGDPNRPVITGRVYNADQMPPYSLPGNKTQSGWKTDSSLGGGGFNELRFEDLKGEEEVYLQAEKDNTILVKNDRNELVQHDESVRIDNMAKHSVGVNLDEDVGNNKTTIVGVDRTVTIGSNDVLSIGANRTQTVGASESITIGSSRTDSVATAETRSVGAAQIQNVGGARTVSVGGAQNHAIGGVDGWQIGGSRSVTIGGSLTTGVGGSEGRTISSSQSTAVGGSRTVGVKGNQGVQVNGNSTHKADGSVKIEAGSKLELVVGGSQIVMTSSKIYIKSSQVVIDASGKVTAKAGGKMTLKGATIHEN